MVDVSEDQLKQVRAILAKHVPEYTIWAFGSRVGGEPKPFSDLDLVIVSERPMAVRTLALLEDAFSESDLPFKVDVLDWSTTSATFRAIIEANHEVIWPSLDA